MNILGTDGADRDGIFWTVTHMDHPARILYSDPHRTKTGTASLVGLSVREVRYAINLKYSRDR